MPPAALLLVAACLPAPLRGQAVRLSSAPLLGPDDEARLEGRAAAAPDDLATRVRLLRHYWQTPPRLDHPARRAARLAHIIYLLERHPASLEAAEPCAYVFRSGGPWANGADHEQVRQLWLNQAQARAGEPRVLLNAARFLFVESKQEAEDLLAGALERQPGDARLAANLGFLYALDVLGLDRPEGALSAPLAPAEREEAKRRALAQLEDSPALVRAGAAAALPNLAIRSSRGGPVDPALFELAARLMAEARRLAPDEPELRGPMPLVHYLKEAVSPP
jgi:hypothetical protein